VSRTIHAAHENRAPRSRVTPLLAVLAIALTLNSATAVEYFRLSPSEFAADLRKAAGLLEEAQYAPAIALLETLVADEPKDADALSLMGYALRKSGDLDEAEGFYTRALAADPTHPGALQYMGELHVQRGELARARELLVRLDEACGPSCPGREELAAAIAAAH
jgi:Flp pilus assembly protein TadD